MFNFIFEGKIGEMLAPISNPNQQLFLAIQHHRQEEVKKILSDGVVNITSNADSGYSAIHIACRYNNRLAVDILRSYGVPLELADRNGNTPLHYSAKSGHIDLCKFLVSCGCTISKRNSSGQTPYDVSENHIIRQYLLPLQLQDERQQMDADPSSSAGYNAPLGTSTSYQAPPPLYPPPTSFPPTFAPPPHAGLAQSQQPAAPYPAPPLAYPTPTFSQRPGISPTGPPQQNIMGNLPNPLPAMAPNTQLVATAPVPPPPVGQTDYAHSTTAGIGTAGTSISNKVVAQPTRMIRPDGFHSSASDPALQKKYGHIKQEISIAPPPTVGTAPAASNPYMFNAPTGTGAPPPPAVFSRYVAYDAHTNAPVANPPPISPAPPQHNPHSSFHSPHATLQAPHPNIVSPPTAVQQPPPPPPPFVAPPQLNFAPPAASVLHQQSFNSPISDNYVVNADSSSSSVL